MDGEGYSNQEDYGSRKRPMDNEEHPKSKRFNRGGVDPLLKLLIPVYAAGALIGKGGALLTELRTQCGGNIRISAGKEFYPGTDERIVVLTGTPEQLLDYSKHVMEKVENPGRESTMRRVPMDEQRAKKMRIVLTNLAAGLLIGKGGNTIKTIQTETKARISIAVVKEATVPGERVLTMGGSMDERIEACRQIIDVIASDQSNMANTMLKYPNYQNLPLHPNNNNFNNNDGGRGPSREHRGSFQEPSFNNGGGGGGLPFSNEMDRSSLERALVESIAEKMSSVVGGLTNQSQPSLLRGRDGGSSGRRDMREKVEVKIEIPQGIVGGILGKHGSIIKEFVHRSGGAKFNFSDSREEGAMSRTLTITGNMEQAYQGFNLVNERVEEVEMQQQQQQRQQPQQQQQQHPDRQMRPEGGGYPVRGYRSDSSKRGLQADSSFASSY